MPLPAPETIKLRSGNEVRVYPLQGKIGIAQAVIDPVTAKTIPQSDAEFKEHYRRVKLTLDRINTTEVGKNVLSYLAEVPTLEENPEKFTVIFTASNDKNFQPFTVPQKTPDPTAPPNKASLYKNSYNGVGVSSIVG